MNSRVPAGPESSSETGAPIGLDRDHKAQEAAALALGVHHSRKRRDRIGPRRETPAQPVLGELAVLGTLKHAGEQSIPSSPERIR